MRQGRLLRLINEYLDGEISQRDKTALFDEVRHNAKSRDLLTHYARMDSAMGRAQFPLGEVLTSVPQGHWTGWFSWCAGGAAIGALATLVFLAMRQPPATSLPQGLPNAQLEIASAKMQEEPVRLAEAPLIVNARSLDYRPELASEPIQQSQPDLFSPLSPFVSFANSDKFDAIQGDRDDGYLTEPDFSHIRSLDHLQPQRASKNGFEFEIQAYGAPAGRQATLQSDYSER